MPSIADRYSPHEPAPHLDTPNPAGKSATLPASPAPSTTAEPPQAALDTPARRALESPVHTAQRRHCGDTLGTTHSNGLFRLSLAQWKALRNVVSSNPLAAWAKNKLRYSYNPDDELLVIHMPGSLHETFRIALENTLSTKLEALCSTEDELVSQQLLSISPRGSADVMLGESAGRQPNSPWHFVGHVDSLWFARLRTASMAMRYITLPSNTSCTPAVMCELSLA